MRRRHFLLLPALMKAVPLKAAARAVQEFPVVKFGTVGDGKLPDTDAIQKAIEAAGSAAVKDGTAIVRFPAGRYLSGSILLKSGVTLRLDEGATLLGITDPNAYRAIDPFTEGTGHELGYAFIGAVDATNVGIEGPGTIDGQGKEVLAGLKPAERNRRPFLVRFVRCNKVTLKDVKLRQSAVWTVHFSQCHNVTAQRVSINSHAGANNDGIDVDSCELVHISECDIDTGDDSICLKTTSLVPCRDVTIANCKLRSNCATIKIGTESAGNFDNIKVTGCQLFDARLAGVKLLTVDGAHLQNVEISDITMSAGRIPIFLRLGARLRTFRPGDPKKGPGTLENVSIRNFRASAEGPAILISGIPGHRVSNVRIQDVQVKLTGGGTEEDAAAELPEVADAYPEITMFGRHLPAAILYARHVEGLEVSGLRASFDKPDRRPEKVLIDAEGVTTTKWEVTPEPPGPSPKTP